MKITRASTTTPRPLSPATITPKTYSWTRATKEKKKKKKKASIHTQPDQYQTRKTVGMQHLGHSQESLAVASRQSCTPSTHEVTFSWTLVFMSRWYTPHPLECQVPMRRKQVTTNFVFLPPVKDTLDEIKNNIDEKATLMTTNARKEQRH